MAKKTIQELKERFKTGMFPTQSDYEDVFDSILTTVTTDDVKGVGEDSEKTLTQILESIDTSKMPDGLDDFIRNVESFLAGIEENKTLAELLEGLKEEYTAGDGINISNNTISVSNDIAKKNDIPSLEGYAKTSEIPSLDGYAKTSEIPDISTKADVKDIPSLDGYATEVYVNNSLEEIGKALQKVVNGETPVGKEYTAGNGININGDVISANTDVLATKNELNNKANKSDIPDVSNFITRNDIPELPDTSNFATKNEIPTVPKNVSAFNNDAGYLTEHQDLSNYATKSEIPSLEGYATEDYVNNAVANAGGSGNSGNYLKLVDDLDSYEGAEGEIVKYSGESNDKYIQGADYIVHNVEQIIIKKDSSVYTTNTDNIPFPYIKTTGPTLTIYKYSTSYTTTLGGKTGPAYDTIAVIKSLNIYFRNMYFNGGNYNAGVYDFKDTDVITETNITLGSRTFTYDETINLDVSSLTCNNNLYYETSIKGNHDYGNYVKISLLIDRYNNVIEKAGGSNGSIKSTSTIKIADDIIISSDGEKYTLTDFCKRALNIE